jgi:hypothetical protein
MRGRFRKKPIVIEAWQWTGSKQEAEEIVEWIASRGGDAQLVSVQGLTHSIGIATLEGEVMAVTNDWIIQGVQGEFHPCKPDIFEQTYERVL